MDQPSEQDARHFGFLRRNPHVPKSPEVHHRVVNRTSLPTGPAIDDVEYNMGHGKRGRAILLNHVVFNNSQSPRAGAELDALALSSQLKKMGFTVEIYTNKKKREIFDLLAEVAAYDHSDMDCLMFVVMTHGDPNELCAFDGSYRSNKIWEAFTNDKCKTLVGKPKLFFIQACRGDQVDSGVRVSPMSTQTDATPRVAYTIPVMSDILIANATSHGYYAWRSATSGSWFIQALVRELSDFGSTQEICQILTRVNRRVAIHYASYVPDNNAQHMKKQMPNFLSTLTRELYFRPKTV